MRRSSRAPDARTPASTKPPSELVQAIVALRAELEARGHDAGAENLRVTSQHLEELVAEAKRTKRKLICFVTGVPGAGKTLVGLDIATTHIDKGSELYSVFLSGNGPLVAVLCEALAREGEGDDEPGLYS